MQSFFGSVQSWFRDENSGRYIARIIKQVCEQDPHPFRDFFKRAFPARLGTARCRSLMLELESPFEARGQASRADLGVRVDGQLVGYVELKYRDRLAPFAESKDSQLSRYLRVCKERRVGFLLITRDPLVSKDARAIKEGGEHHCRFADLALVLGTSQHPATHMLLDYFREEGLVMAELDEDALYRFLHRWLNPYGGSGRITSKDALSDGPAQFQAFLANMKLISEELSPWLRTDDDGRRRRLPTVDFYVQPELRVDSLRAIVNRAVKEGEPTVWAPRAGGQVWIYAQSAVGNTNNFTNIEFGFILGIAPDRAHRVAVSQYARVSAQDFGRNGEVPNREKAIPFNLVANPERRGKLEERFREMIYECAQEARLTGRLRVAETQKRLRHIAAGLKRSLQSS